MDLLAEGSASAVVEVDGDRVLGDVSGNDGVCIGPAEGDSGRRP
jgi:hypothetical protein